MPDSAFRDEIYQSLIHAKWPELHVTSFHAMVGTVFQFHLRIHRIIIMEEAALLYDYPQN